VASSSCTFPAVEKAGLSNLNEGAKVSYEIVDNRGKESVETSGSVKAGFLLNLLTDPQATYEAPRFPSPLPQESPVLPRRGFRFLTRGERVKPQQR
jgi:hypothetical protein